MSPRPVQEVSDDMLDEYIEGEPYFTNKDLGAMARELKVWRAQHPQGFCPLACEAVYREPPLDWERVDL